MKLTKNQMKQIKIVENKTKLDANKRKITLFYRVITPII